MFHLEDDPQLLKLLLDFIRTNTANDDSASDSESDYDSDDFDSEDSSDDTDDDTMDENWDHLDVKNIIVSA